MTRRRLIGRGNEKKVRAPCRLSQLVGGNVVSPNPLKLGSPVVKGKITGKVGRTSPTITMVIWTYFRRCVALNDLKWKGNRIPQKRDTTWQNHHTAA